MNDQLDFDEILAQVGRNFRQVRMEKGFSVQALALLSHVDEQIITGIEDGTHNFWLADIFRLAAEMNVDFRRIIVDPEAYPDC